MAYAWPTPAPANLCVSDISFSLHVVDKDIKNVYLYGNVSINGQQLFIRIHLFKSCGWYASTIISDKALDKQYHQLQSMNFWSSRLWPDSHICSDIT